MRQSELVALEYIYSLLCFKESQNKTRNVTSFFRPWGPDQPDNGGAESGKPENCMMMIDFGIGSYLADVPCDTMGNGSVCERNVLEFWENDNDTSTLSPFDFFDGVQVSDCPSGEWHSSGG